MKTLAPHAWERFNAIPADAPHRAVIMRRIVDRHEELERLSNHNPKQYESEVQQLRLEDEILGAASKLRAAQAATADPLKSDLREKVARLVDLRFRNREARLKRLAASLDRERTKLEADRGRREQIIERKLNAVVNGPPGRAGFFGNPGARGGGAAAKRGAGGRASAGDAAPETPTTPGAEPQARPPASK